MSEHTFRDTAALNRLAAVYATLAPHRLPLIRAAREGLVRVIMPSRDVVIPKRVLNEKRQTVILIGDDDETPTGPAGWACARRLAHWGRASMVHGTGGQPEHYAMAAASAMLIERFVLIETCTAHQAAWAELLKPRMPTLMVSCREGDHHPAPYAGAVH
jgi:hypothetical protein